MILTRDSAIRLLAKAANALPTAAPARPTQPERPMPAPTVPEKKTASPYRPMQVVTMDADDPEEYLPLGVEAILEASGKLLSVNRGEVDEDDRDHYAFKRVVTPAKFLRDRIRLDADRVRRNAAAMVARRRTLDALAPGIFDGYVDGLVNGNPLVLPLEEINPLHLLEQARRLTHMGPGGIGSSDAITPGMQAVNASQFGFVSAIEGPESSLAGVDVRAATGVKLGSDGKLYQRFKNRNGDFVWLSPEETQDLIVKLPD